MACMSGPGRGGSSGRSSARRAHTPLGWRSSPAPPPARGRGRPAEARPRAQPWPGPGRGPAPAWRAEDAGTDGGCWHRWRMLAQMDAGSRSSSSSSRGVTAVTAGWRLQRVTEVRSLTLQLLTLASGRAVCCIHRCLGYYILFKTPFH